MKAPTLFYEFLNFRKEERFDVLEWHNELDDAPRLPFKFYEDHNAFKLFMLDVGLMGLWPRRRQSLFL